MFPEGEHAGLYHTADATLWFFHAIYRYLAAHERPRDPPDCSCRSSSTSSTTTFKGRRFNIHVDPADGLLSQGDDGYQLTWMDAKVDDWVVTPRRGKAVEINALWYNALRLLEQLVRSRRATRRRRVAWPSYADRAREIVQRAVLVRGRAAISTTSSTASRRRSGRPPEPDLRASRSTYPVLDERRWQRVSTS